MNRLFPLLALAVLLAAGASARAPERKDVVFADFEGPDYGDWVVTGEAFGKGPARGALPGQMPVTGFKGKGLVSSFHGGDDSTGTLASPEFEIQRHHVTFLIGGGHHPGKACINLLVGGKVVRTATGPNKVPGGTERLEPASWDVKEFAGKKARIEIVDRAKGGWGHVNVDHVVFTDRKPPGVLLDARREVAIEKRYLSFPVKTGGQKRRLSLSVDGKPYRELEIELADGKPDFWAFLDAGEMKGKKAILQVDRLPEGSPALKAIEQGDQIKGAEQFYKEKRRPQFHFTSRVGWLNDPNGLVCSKGEFHLFYQHNPYGWGWGNMHWGHAVSKDLVHWQELPIALSPRKFGDWCFSGSAVVDRANTGGWKKGAEDVLVAAYTSTGRGECIAYSTDRGRTWAEPPGNPVVRHAGRDPKLLWHAPTKKWVMAVYDEHAGKQWIAFHSSPDLKKWTFQSRIEGFYECPDLFELPVDGKADKKKWVTYAADGKYVLGQFDGKAFEADPGKHQLWHGNFYAAQTFSDAPDGRRIQIGWAQGIAFPGMPFNQQMTLPCELSLRTTPAGVRMFAQPVKEIETLRVKGDACSGGLLKPGRAHRAKTEGELLDVLAEFSRTDAEAFGLTVRGVAITYDVKKEALACQGRVVHLKGSAGKVRLRVLVDRASIEVFAQDGAAALVVPHAAPAESKSVEAFTRGGDTRVGKLEVHQLKSAWAVP